MLPPEECSFEKERLDGVTMPVLYCLWNTQESYLTFYVPWAETTFFIKYAAAEV